LSLVPNAWWANAVRTDQLLTQHRWFEAETAANAVLASAPASEVDALAIYATFLMNVGRIVEAVEFYRIAQRADPLSLRVSGHLQLFLDLAGRRDEAQAEFERSRDLAGDHGRWDWAALLRLWSRDDADPAAVKVQFQPISTLRPLDRALVGPWTHLRPRDSCRSVDDPANQNPDHDRDFSA
jgi:tetratricopeptide (TPR) repeat protein